MLFKSKAKNNFLEGIINSYSQVFFSRNPVFAVILILVSFFDVYAGLAGLLAVIFANSTAILLSLNKKMIYSGAYGFNPLLVGLGIGIYYQPGAEFYLLLFFISITTLFITIGFEGVLGKYGLPYLSLPFLLGIWMVIIASKGYSALNISERGVYNLNDMYAIGGVTMVKTYEWFNNLNIPESLRIYFKSLSAILFQYHMFAGFLIALGLLYFSRISFMVSLIGFYSAYSFYNIIGANISELTYSYIGFNYILMSIAIGGFFIVPSKRSVMWVILLTPIVSIFLSSTTYFFSHFQLSVFSLPFNVVVILFIYVLKFRQNPSNKLALVVAQQFSPEKHSYNFNSYLQRFGLKSITAIKLPFWGVWNVTQAHNGKHTHKDAWRYAWDFEMSFDGKTYAREGDFVEDYYCFNKPVTAPADGVIEEVEGMHSDNQIGDVDLENNWGNSIVINHGSEMYSQLSHLKEDSIKVVVGQNVKQGEVIALCGNSGRSPVPHLHMQLQSTPSIGSKTIDHPFSACIIHNENDFKFETSFRPEINQQVSNIETNKTVAHAFHFIPGQILDFETLGHNSSKYSWEVKADIYNNTYLECASTKAKAWFKNVGDVFYFTAFEGKQNTLLYFFYLASYKVISAFYKNMTLEDEYPLTVFPKRGIILLQDFCIPFFKFLNAKYSMHYSSEEEIDDIKIVHLNSKAQFGTINRIKHNYEFSLKLSEKGLEEFVIQHNKNKTIAKRIFK
jgi:urea transporter/murein DD-endopeptidase MepM/ murein hydrolase activator NlpD